MIAKSVIFLFEFLKIKSYLKSDGVNQSKLPLKYSDLSEGGVEPVCTPLVTYFNFFKGKLSSLKISLINAIRSSFKSEIRRCFWAMSVSIWAVFWSKNWAMAVCSGSGGIVSTISFNSCEEMAG